MMCSQDEDHLSLGKIICGLHGLSIHDINYAVLYAQCLQRFLDIAQQLAKLEMFQTSTPLTFQMTPHLSWPQPPAARAISTTPPSAPTYQLHAQQPPLTSTSSEAEAFFCKPHLDRLAADSACTPDIPPSEVSSSHTIPFQHDAPPHAALSFKALWTDIHVA